MRQLEQKTSSHEDSRIHRWPFRSMRQIPQVNDAEEKIEERDWASKFMNLVERREVEVGEASNISI